MYVYFDISFICVPVWSVLCLTHHHLRACVVCIISHPPAHTHTHTHLPTHYTQIAAFITRRGRLTVAELARESNKLIDLQRAEEDRRRREAAKAAEAAAAAAAAAAVEGTGEGREGIEG